MTQKGFLSVTLCAQTKALTCFFEWKTVIAIEGSPDLFYLTKT